MDKSAVTTYYDSISGKPLFKAPIGRSFDDFVRESRAHGWPVRCRQRLALTSNIPPDRPPGLQHTALMTTTTTALRCVHACMPRPAVPMRAPPRPARWLPRGRG